MGAIILFLLMTGCKKDLPEYLAISYNTLPDEIDFNLDVKPILSDKCYSCHGPDERTRKAEMRFDTENGLYEKTLKGNFPVKPGNPGKSELIQRILSVDPAYIMPPSESHLSLTSNEKAILLKWVEQGAKWKKHWAFIPPEKPTVPKISKDWAISNEIDAFIYNKLIQNNLEPNKAATKEKLLRRVTIDLTGLPPTLNGINDFINDKSPDAYEKVVDRLLQSKSHAERLTLEWMDLARYSDSHGYHADGSRMMWPWRDWVIDAFYNNKPYNVFVTEQLAGDLLPNATKEQILATGFNRNHPMTAEGGAIDEEFRVDYVTNRTNTFGTAFLGMTMECAKCHDHKFDPISQQDYFKLFAFFNNNRELGMTFEDGNFGPLMLMSTQEEDQKIAEIDVKIDSIEKLTKSYKQKLVTKIDFKESNEFKQVAPIVHHPFEKTTKKEKFINLDGIIGSKIEKEVELVQGKIGLAAKFDNQYDKIDLTNLDPFEIYDPFSISIWVNPKQRSVKGTTMTIIGNAAGKPEVYKGWDVHIDADGRISSRLTNVAPNNYIQVRTGDSIPLGKWTHILMTYDGSTKATGLNIYINGQETAQDIEYDRLSKSIIPRAKGNLVVGKSLRGQSGDNGIFIGMLDHLSIYNTEIYPSQVSSIFEQSQTGIKPMAWIIDQNEYLEQTSNLRQLLKDRMEIITPIKEMMVMEEMQPQRKTYVLERGEYDKPKNEVERGAPNSILEFTSEYPKNRLGLSQWLFDDKNPLASRVAVNRYWQMIFGRGLVSTPNDFGNQGAMPSHSKLLDWLAVDFIESGWDLRQLIKKIVISNTYKQSSKIKLEMHDFDPDNTLLASSPTYRLQAEFIRNNALYSSGLLNNTIGGESVKPYQPEGLWVTGNFSKDLSKYVQDHDSKQYRKSMYTFIKRTAPPPYMTIFDMPTRDICIVSREQTNTPLQALSLLNDPQFVEASKALAVRMKTEGGNSLQGQIETGFLLAISRKPSSKELEILTELYNHELNTFKEDKKSAIAYLSVGDYQVPKALDPNDIAALTIVANTLFNLDEMYMKR